MYYIIQENVFKDPRYDEIFEVLDSLKLPYEKVRFIPNSDTFQFKTNRKDIFVYGSVKLARIAKKYYWNPGSFYGGNHESENYLKGFGENVLNFKSKIIRISDTIDWELNPELFIKPAIAAKIFTGKVFNKYSWEDFLEENLKGGKNRYINSETIIQIAKPEKLIKEARIWIVNNEIVTSSYYKFHGDIPYEETVSKDGIAFAEKMIKKYHVADAYVMDIVFTSNGWKIMEVNCINSAGFYKADIRKIIIALEKFYKN
ncbi:ATP-grasp domain-containing protein [Aureivirga marina]|uniref:ATP-grasp domain-containing protein n=1 Tax=Aureivirga marina TaxID=1182451 RepID=UPI0018C9AC7D|nr:ATP-grasp domain-containing protein [Aureivirga marina]